MRRSSRAHEVRTLFAVTCAGMALSFAPTFVSSAFADAVTCQRAVAKASAQFAQAKLKALQKCGDMVVSHAISGPCPDATATAKIAKADSKLRAAVSKGCGGGGRAPGARGGGEAPPP